MPLTMSVFPVSTEAELPEVFREHAVEPAEPFAMDCQQIGEHREDWIEEWTATVLR